MLSGHERRVLRDIERRVAADDPGFARSFTRRGMRPHHHSEVPAIVAAVVAVLLCVPLLLAGSLLGALAVAVTIALVWAAWRRSTAPDRHPRT